MLIDFHTHVFPDKIAERSIAALTEGIYREQGTDYGNGAPLHVRPATLQGLLDSMEHSGVTQSICLPIATKVSQTESINRYAENIRNHRALSFGTVHPDDPDALAVLDDLAARGFRGIKLHLQFQRSQSESVSCGSIYVDVLRSVFVMRATILLNINTKIISNLVLGFISHKKPYTEKRVACRAHIACFGL